MPANIYMLKVNNGNTSETCKICSKLSIKTPEREYTLFSLKNYWSLIDAKAATGSILLKRRSLDFCKLTG